MSGTTPAPKAYLLGAELRQARAQSGLGLRELAAQLDLSHSVLVRWEKGDRVPNPESVSAYLARCEASSAERDRIIALAREAAEEPVNSVSVGARGQAAQLAALLELERSAVELIDVSPLVVPGLLQGEDYTRAILSRVLPKVEVESRATLRLGRRNVITRDRAPVRYTAFIFEPVLHQSIGSHEVLAEQLGLLLKLGQRDNVTVRIIPCSAGWTPAHAGSFMMLKFAAADPVVLLEHYQPSVFLRHAGDVQVYLSAVDDLARVAMTAEESAKHIAGVIDRMETTE